MSNLHSTAFYVIYVKSVFYVIYTFYVLKSHICIHHRNLFRISYLKSLFANEVCFGRKKEPPYGASSRHRAVLSHLTFVLSIIPVPGSSRFRSLLTSADPAPHSGVLFPGAQIFRPVGYRSLSRPRGPR